jgi:hypothetical protein
MSDGDTNSIALVISSIGLLAATAGLAWNEYSAYQRYRDLAWAQEHIRSINADTVESEADGQLVHMVGKLTTEGTRRDPVFNIETSAARLDRVVERNKQTSPGISEGGRSYEWVRRRRDAEHPVIPEDGRPNPDEPVVQDTFVADDPTVGAYHLSDDIVAEMDGETIELDRSVTGGFPEPLERAYSPLTTYDGKETVCVPADPGTGPCGEDVGDIRVYWETFEQGMVGLYGELDGDTITEFDAPALDDPLADITAGPDPAYVMLDAGRGEAEGFRWRMRLLGTGIAVAFCISLFSDLRRREFTFPLVGPLDHFGKVVGTSLLTGLAIGTTATVIGYILPAVAI